jgi:hypothetical protein
MFALAESTVGRDINVHLYGDSARRANEHRRARRVPRVVDAQYEDWVARSFVEPGGWEQAKSILVQRRMVLLTAASGSGGRTAAIRLLRDDERRTPIHELPVHEDRDEQVLDRDTVAENDRLLLDLATVGDDLTEALQGELPAFWGTVRERNASLVVVLPERKGRALDAELGGLLVPLGRPNGTLVLERHLAAYGIAPAPDDLGRLDWLEWSITAACRTSRTSRRSSGGRGTDRTTQPASLSCSSRPSLPMLSGRMRLPRMSPRDPGAPAR